MYGLRVGGSREVGLEWSINLGRDGTSLPTFERILSMTFADALRTLRLKAGKSRYRLAQFSGVDEAYILRLERGHRSNPSRDVVLMLAIALVENSETANIYDVDALLLAAGYAPLRRRGQVEATAFT